MKPASFQSEQWMTEYEHQARVNLTDSSADSLSFSQLAALEKDLLEDLVLDYGVIEGDPRLREEILSLYQNRDPATLALSQGCSQANRLVMEVLLEAGDHVITFIPGYQQFWEIPKRMGCDVSLIALDEQKNWSFLLDELEKTIRPQTRLLILNNPSNPSGSYLNREDLERLADLCRKHDLYVLCDEVYLYPDDAHPSFSDLYEKALATSSLSKILGLPGLRTGWIKGDPKVIEAVAAARDYSLISTGPLLDAMALIALRHREAIRKPIEQTIETNRRIIDEWLSDHPDFSWVSPQAGPLGLLRVHADISSEDFAKKLLEETGIFFVPGSCFEAEGHFRLSLGFRHENLKQTLDEIQSFLDRYKEQNLQKAR